MSWRYHLCQLLSLQSSLSLMPHTHFYDVVPIYRKNDIENIDSTRAVRSAYPSCVTAIIGSGS
jgi:hypothetical protein